MKLDNVAGYSSISDFVKSKLNKLNSGECRYENLYELMFSEKENIMFEQSVGYRIKKTTYGECRDEIEKKASALPDLLEGVRAGDTVGIYLENGIEWLECFWAVIRAGYNALLMNSRLDVQTLEKVIEQTNTKAVISDSVSFSVKTVSPDKLEAKNLIALPDSFGEEIFIISSGTSSNVKICSYGAKELCSTINNALDIVTRSKEIKEHYEGELKLLTFLPFYHIFGFVAVYLWFAFFSRTFVQLNDMNPSTIVNTIKRHKVTHVFAVPLFWNKVYESALSTIRSRGEKTVKKFEKGLAISKKLENAPLLYKLFGKAAFGEIRENMFGDSIKFMITGGSEIRREVLEFFNAIGYHLANGYGMTEIGITSVELASRPAILCSGSAGIPLESVEYDVASDGELLVRASSSARYMIENGEKVCLEEWFHTRDLAEIKDGRLYVLGRKDDLIISPSGENLNPNLAEESIGKIKNVRDICLVGVKEKDGKKPVLIAGVEKYLDDEALKTVEKDIASRLSQLKLNTRISEVFITEDPLIDGNEIKLNRRLIAERYSKGLFEKAGALSNAQGITGDKLMRRVAELFADILGRPADSMTEDYDFFIDGGGTSLDYFTLISAIREEFSVATPSSAEKTLSRISEISEFIKNSRTG